MRSGDEIRCDRAAWTVQGRVRLGGRVSKLDEIEEENYVTQRDVIRELSS